MKNANNKAQKQQTWLFNEEGAFLLLKEAKSRDKNMNKRTNPFTFLFRDNSFYIAAFFLPAGILLLSYICFGIYPFNGLLLFLQENLGFFKDTEIAQRSVLSLDLNAQYVYYFDYMYDVFKGTESLFYSWSRNLSGEFFGIIGYYLASPFNFIVWAFPRHMITEGLMLMLLVKVGFIGVTASVYLNRARGLSTGTTLIFSMMYALSAYTIVQTMNPMWLDGVMALPLVVYGVETLVRHGRFRLLIISLVYSFITSFYIGYMVGIFAGIYFIYYLTSSRAAEDMDGAAIAARVGMFSISAATSVLISSFMLIPVYNSLQLGKFNFSEPDYSMRTNFSLLDVARKLLPNSYDTVRWDGLPFLYCGVLAVILVPLFFVSGSEKLISIKKRVASATLVIILMASMYIVPVDMYWHGGQVPNWLPYRYSFMLSFLLIIWSAEIYERIEKFSRRAVAASAMGIFAIVLFLENTDTYSESLGRELFDKVEVVLPALFAVVLFTLILMQAKNKGFSKSILSGFIGTIVVMELFFNTFAQLNKQHQDIVFSERNSYTEWIVPLRDKIDELVGDDDGFYRMDKTFFRSVNDPMALGIYGLSHSSSTLNEKPIELLKQLGFTGREHYTRFSGATPLTETLFGVKYIMEIEGNSGYMLRIDVDDVKLRENKDAMPVAYLASTTLAGFNFENYAYDGSNVFKKQNRLLAAIVGDDLTTDYFKIINESLIEVETENLTTGYAAGGYNSYKKIIDNDNAQVKLNMYAEADGEIFMWLPSNHERKVNLWVYKYNEDGALTGNEYKGQYFETDDYHIKSLGVFEEGERFMVGLTLTRDDLYLRDLYFAYINEEVYRPAIERLHAMNADTIVSRTGKAIVEIDTNSEASRLLFTTIPAEPGWIVTVDGMETSYIEVFDSLIGIMLPAGSHTVKMEFKPAGFPLAFYLSGGGVVVFIILCIIYMRVRKDTGVLDITKNKGHNFNPSDNDEYSDDDYSEEESIDLILGSDESFKSAISSFKEINDEIEEQLTTPVEAHVDNELWTIEEKPIIEEEPDAFGALPELVIKEEPITEELKQEFDEFLLDPSPVVELEDLQMIEEEAKSIIEPKPDQTEESESLAEEEYNQIKSDYDFILEPESDQTEESEYLTEKEQIESNYNFILEPEPAPEAEPELIFDEPIIDDEPDEQLIIEEEPDVGDVAHIIPQEEPKRTVEEKPVVEEELVFAQEAELDEAINEELNTVSGETPSERDLELELELETRPDPVVQPALHFEPELEVISEWDYLTEEPEDIVEEEPVIDFEARRRMLEAELNAAPFSSIKPNEQPIVEEIPSTSQQFYYTESYGMFNDVFEEFEFTADEQEDYFGTFEDIHVPPEEDRNENTYSFGGFDEDDGDDDGFPPSSL